MVNLNTRALVILALLIFTATTTTTAAIDTANTLKLTMCSTTDYKNTCMKSLRAAGITRDPRLLLRTAFFAAIHGTQKAINATSIQYDSNAMVDYEICKELLDLSTDDIKKAIKKLEEIKLNPENRDQLLYDIRTRLSGSLTFHQTCMDEIQNVTRRGDLLRILHLSTELSSNALAMLAFEKDLANWSWTSKENKRLVMSSLPSPSAALKDQVTIFIVSKDGSGMFKTINGALSAIPITSDNDIERKYLIYVKPGVYKEYVEITKNMKNVFLIGYGPSQTRIVGNRSVKGGFKTFRTPTVIVNGENFLARDISIENTAGPENDQAVALRITADKSIIYNCYIAGNQDTLYAHAHRQFYRDCTISGTVDFIFGNAAAVFQNCKIVFKQPRINQNLRVISAQSRTDWRSNTGFVFQNCTITADETYYAKNRILRSFLGRPWKKYSRTIFMESEIHDVIDPAGWMPWIGQKDYLLTIWYGEYLNRGRGADLRRRVNWIGYHKNITDEVAAYFVPRRFIDGDHWITAVDIPYFPNFNI
ncbi:pectinesterase-like [Impatiens glandulifera]|uniref:pectinesterase-like n=1 Tax=Impatiens glandulifera TaxID=253017 RepID=UPI001FB12BB5|nr:pectinesterase-like [Impatiens glandulifera]